MKEVDEKKIVEKEREEFAFGGRDFSSQSRIDQSYTEKEQLKLHETSLSERLQISQLTTTTTTMISEDRK